MKIQIAVPDTNMKLTFENFAKAGNGSIYVNDLTVICGHNNTGKTYISYAIYSILQNLKSHFQYDLNKEGIQKVISGLGDTATIDIPNPKTSMKFWIEQNDRILEKEFHNFFKLPESNFENLKIALDFDNINFEPTESFSFTRLGNKFTGKFVANGSGNKVVVAIDELSESFPFFEWSDEEKFEFVDAFY